MRRHALVASLMCLVNGCSSGTGQALNTENPVAPPEIGAYAGAYVDPEMYFESQRIAAFEEFEDRVGRRLDLFHTFHTWTDPFPAEAEMHFAERGTIPLISWAGTELTEILLGEYDTLIVARARALGRLTTPVLLRWRWEMNRRNLAGEISSPEQYVAAWRHIHDLFEAESVSNVAWVWCPLVDPLADQNFSAYYPGDDVVDWICADGYAREVDLSWEDVFSPFLKWAEDIDRPILIGEFARASDLSSPAGLAHWLAEARKAMKGIEQIKAFAYFNNARGTSGNYDLLPYDEAVSEMRVWLRDAYFNVRKQ